MGDMTYVPLEQSQQPALTGLILWLSVGGTVVVAMGILLSVVLWIMHRRKTSPRKLNCIPEIPTIRGHTCTLKTNTETCTSSSDDMDPSYPYPTIPSPKRMALIQSPSLDDNNKMGTGEKAALKRANLPRWHSMGSYYPSTVIGKVQPDLYKGSDDDEPSSPPCGNGRLWFLLSYSEEDESLKVNVLKAKYLPGRGYNNSPRDPFVRVFLLPDEEHFEQTKTRRRTLSPKFNEILNFKVSKDELSQRTLRLSMYDIDKRRVRHSLGHIFLVLSKINLTSNEVQSRDLESTCQANTVGDLQLTLSCNPLTSRLKVVIGRLKNVRGIDNGKAGLYIRVQLSHGHKLMKTKKTALQHHNKERDEVVFDEAFNFVVASRYFDAFSINLTAVVAGPTPLIKDQPIGKVVVGPFMHARGDPLLHWQEMLSNPRSLVTRWHTLEETTV